MVLMLVGFWGWNPAEAHENEIWKDAEKHVSHGTHRCGMGYILAYTGEQTWQPYLMAGHMHMTDEAMPTPSCKLFFNWLDAQDTSINEDYINEDYDRD
jgi:hypothetical protein